MHDPALRLLIEHAVKRVHRDLGRLAPKMSKPVWTWLRSLSHGAPVAEYFTPDWGYPLFSLPYWVEKQLVRKPSTNFQRDWAYSTVAGYFHIRLIDDLLDRDTQLSPTLLPASAFFQSRFHRAYFEHFTPDSPFWRLFDRDWMECHEACFVDSRARGVTKKAFREVAARKTIAGRIPVAAVCLHYGRDDLVSAWDQLAEVMGCYVQMVDDLFDWPSDASQNRATFLLSEGRRRQRPSESRLDWFVREGIDLGLGFCLGWLDELEQLAGQVRCQPLQRMLVRRRHALLLEVGQLRHKVRHFAKLGPCFPASGH